LSDDWWKRKRRSYDSWSNIFEDFDRIEDEMDEMMRRTFGTPPERRKGFRPRAYDFSISREPYEKPTAHESGATHLNSRKLRVREDEEPLIDVLEEGKDVVVVAEAPGVKKDEIYLHSTKDLLTISVDTSRRKYHRQLLLPAEVDPRSARASYRNGVLEIRLRKLLETPAKVE